MSRLVALGNISLEQFKEFINQFNKGVKMEEYSNSQSNVFSDLQYEYMLIEDINASIREQYKKIKDAEEEVRQLKTNRNAYFADFLDRAKEIRMLCEHYSNEMEQVNGEIRNNDEQLEKLRRKLTDEDDPTETFDFLKLRPSAVEEDPMIRRFPEAL